MAEAEPFQCLMVGLPQTGKTTFLAALWHVLKSNEVPGSLVLKRREGDLEYLNQIAEQWSKCSELNRTPISGQMGVTIVLRDPARETLFQMSIPDLSGELYASLWEDRSCSPEFAELAANAGGCIAFLHPGTLSQTAWIANANAVYEGWAGEDETVAEEVSSETAATTDWNAKDAPTQVQMVEILQFLTLLAGKPLRLALVISAWDLVKENITPDAWVESQLPLLSQFLRSNDGQFEVAFMGVSAQGGPTSDAENLLALSIAARRVQIVAPDIDGNDITHPIRWLMSPGK